PRDIDTVVLHGLDPNTGALDTELSDYLTKAGSSIAVPSTGSSAAQIDADFTTAVAALDGQDITGVAIAPAAAAKLATITEGNQKKYEGLGVFGLTGATIAGKRAASTPEVAAKGTELILGDWSKLYLGFAGAADWKVIEYGNPDGGSADLQNVNQVCIRMELKFGFRVLDPTAFAVVASGAESES
ncbi:MAG: phage major capsid protein, partial [Psychrobacter sp.]|nr:phage major capsid protein [Psychrobacter sp.]